MISSLDILFNMFCWIFKWFILFIGNCCRILRRYKVWLERWKVCWFWYNVDFEIVLLNLKLYVISFDWFWMLVIV